MNSSLHKKERVLIGLFLFIPLLLLITFGFLPLLEIISYSFTSWNGISSQKPWVGWNNYVKVLTSPQYFQVFINNLYYFVSGLLQILIALYLAILLSFKVKFKSFFKASIVFPTLISGVAISMMFRLFYTPGGPFDTLLITLGLEKLIHFWLGDPRYVNYTLAGISLWRHTGLRFLMFYAAIQTIPKEYYQVAEIEGATTFQKIRYIILPNIHTILKINFILLTVGAVTAFEIPMIITNGSNGTTTFLLQTLKTAFEQKQLGLAASMAVVMMLALILLTSLQKKLFRNDDYDF
ncbi:MAG: sugar ABC transporter permease [Turicibacter sp.]|jgi:ABC-type sugar transport system permease subunit|nr:sugar ABC transporter permease [Turicibacter sp. TS3]MCI8702414.1 sugar ABC transporter permease [Turicibacter sp.]MCI9351039.1 sugar ABC transporter permease [Turicibacter sp.]NCE78764.1 sugar ABC transporter permease [Turicibacter sp. TS3]